MDIYEIEQRANRFLAEAIDEVYFDKSGRRIYTSASVGCQSAERPIFDKIAGHIENHLTPWEFFQDDFGDSGGGRGLSVISFAFHLNKEIVHENSAETLHPSYSWYEARDKFELVIIPFMEFVRNMFGGYRIVFPYKSSLYEGISRRNVNGKSVPASNWSERHAAFACGLGSFGLHGALITDKGCTHRLLSAITDYEFPVYAETSGDYYFNCLNFKKGTCGKCMRRCPVNSIIHGVHDTIICYRHEMVTNKAKSLDIYGREVAACALCMCGVPCSNCKPV